MSEEKKRQNWFQRIREGIRTPTKEKKEAPDGLWVQCKSCKNTSTQRILKDNQFVCEHCDYHERIGSEAYFDILFDKRSARPLFNTIQSTDFLNFTDLKSYSDRINQNQDKTGLDDAIQVAEGKINEEDAVVAAMDFSFIGGSMGSVVGEKISMSVDYCIDEKKPFLCISKSGGARMMESAFSLMQMAKTSAKLTQLAKAKLPYISILTDPTTGGVTASFAMLGDVNIAEPNALIGFAGPRVIKETIKKDLPKGFQRSEFLLEHGFLDAVVHRKDLKNHISNLLLAFRS